MSNQDIEKVLNGSKILFAEDCNSVRDFYDLQNLKAIIEEENEKYFYDLQNLKAIIEEQNEK
jgi:hypothetical protein